MNAQDKKHMTQSLHLPWLAEQVTIWIRTMGYTSKLFVSVPSSYPWLARAMHIIPTTIARGIWRPDGSYCKNYPVYKIYISWIHIQITGFGQWRNKHHCFRQEHWQESHSLWLDRHAIRTGSITKLSLKARKENRHVLSSGSTGREQIPIAVHPRFSASLRIPFVLEG